MKRNVVAPTTTIAATVATTTTVISAAVASTLFVFQTERLAAIQLRGAKTFGVRVLL